jgi:hypothetical protein
MGARMHWPKHRADGGGDPVQRFDDLQQTIPVVGILGAMNRGQREALGRPVADQSSSTPLGNMAVHQSCFVHYVACQAGPLV